MNITESQKREYRNIIISAILKHDSDISFISLELKADSILEKVLDYCQNEHKKRMFSIQVFSVPAVLFILYYITATNNNFTKIIGFLGVIFGVIGIERYTSTPVVKDVDSFIQDELALSKRNEIQIPNIKNVIENSKPSSHSSLEEELLKSGYTLQIIRKKNQKEMLLNEYKKLNISDAEMYDFLTYMDNPDHPYHKAQKERFLEIENNLMEFYNKSSSYNKEFNKIPFHDNGQKG